MTWIDAVVCVGMGAAFGGMLLAAWLGDEVFKELLKGDPDYR